LHSKKYVDALKYLHFINVTPAMTDIPLRELFSALLLLSGGALAHKTVSNRFLPPDHTNLASIVFERTKIYEALLRDKSVFLITLFSSVEMETVSVAGESALPNPFALISEAGTPAAFWSEFALFVHSKGVHFIELVLSKSQELVKAKR